MEIAIPPYSDHTSETRCVPNHHPDDDFAQETPTTTESSMWSICERRGRRIRAHQTVPHAGLRRRPQSATRVPHLIPIDRAADDELSAVSGRVHPRRIETESCATTPRTRINRGKWPVGNASGKTRVQILRPWPGRECLNNVDPGVTLRPDMRRALLTPGYLPRPLRGRRKGARRSLRSRG